MTYQILFRRVGQQSYFPVVFIKPFEAEHQLQAVSKAEEAIKEHYKDVKTAPQGSNALFVARDLEFSIREFKKQG